MARPGDIVVSLAHASVIVSVVATPNVSLDFVPLPSDLGKLVALSLVLCKIGPRCPAL